MWFRLSNFIIFSLFLKLKTIVLQHISRMAYKPHDVSQFLKAIMDALTNAPQPHGVNDLCIEYDIETGEIYDVCDRSIVIGGRKPLSELTVIELIEMRVAVQAREATQTKSLLSWLLCRFGVLL
jgi:hypothetical protein